jgi:signal transduction histidine kinase
VTGTSELPALMGAAGIPVAVMDQAGVLTWMSPALQSLLEGSTPDSLGAGWTLLGEFGNVRLRLEDLPLAVARERGHHCEAIVTMTSSDGALRHHHWSARPLSSPTGAQLGAMAVITDLTGWAEAARRCLDTELAATVSHRIRTPLTSILGHAELIADCESAPSAASHAASSIQRAAHRIEAVAVWLCARIEERDAAVAVPE